MIYRGSPAVDRGHPIPSPEVDKMWRSRAMMASGILVLFLSLLMASGVAGAVRQVTLKVEGMTCPT